MKDFEEELFLLPSSWTWAKIEDIGANEQNAIVDGPFGSNLKKSDYSDKGKIPVISISNIRNGFDKSELNYITEEKFKTISRSAVKPSDIIAAKIGSVGKVGVYPEWMPIGMIPANLLKITVNQSINKNYVLYYLKSPIHKEFLRKITKSTVQPAFNLTNFRNLPFPLPTISEQERIVQKIESLFSFLDAGLDTLLKLKSQLQLYCQAVLNQACNGKLTESWRKTVIGKIEPASELLEHITKERKKILGKKFKNKFQEEIYKLPELPTNWVWTSIENLTIPDRTIRYGIIKPGPNTPDGIPYVRVMEMKTGKINVAKLKKCRKEHAAKFKAASLKTGDILVSKDGTIGKVAFVPPELEGGNITQHVLRVSPSPLINRYFLARMIESPFCQRWIKRETRGVALQGINVRDFRNLPIPLPPLAEQKQIAEDVDYYLSIAKANFDNVKNNIKKSRNLRKTILKTAFEGKLVAQETTYETAEKLLLRIKQEKNDLKKKRRSQRKTGKKSQRSLTGYVK